MPYVKEKVRSFAPAGGGSESLVVALIMVLLLCAAGNVACGQIKTSQDLRGVVTGEEFVPGEITVWFNDDLSASDVDEAVERTGGEIIRRSDVTPTRVVISVPEGEEGHFVEEYRKMKEVRAADKNRVLRALPAEGGAPGPGAEGGE
jgi:hypothetical protein